MQHYTFAVNAFVELIKQYGMDEYEFEIHETKTHEVIDNVKNQRSEIGVIYMNDYNETVLGKILKEAGLSFTPLFAELIDRRLAGGLTTNVSRIKTEYTQSWALGVHTLTCLVSIRFAFHTETNIGNLILRLKCANILGSLPDKSDEAPVRILPFAAYLVLTRRTKLRFTVILFIPCNFPKREETVTCCKN